jgi:hypothetical protein
MGNAGGAGAGEYRPPITPFAGWVADERTNRLRPLETMSTTRRHVTH